MRTRRLIWMAVLAAGMSACSDGGDGGRDAGSAGRGGADSSAGTDGDAGIDGGAAFDGGVGTDGGPASDGSAGTDGGAGTDGAARSDGGDASGGGDASDGSAAFDGSAGSAGSAASDGGVHDDGVGEDMGADDSGTFSCPNNSLISDFDGDGLTDCVVYFLSPDGISTYFIFHRGTRSGYAEATPGSFSAIMYTNLTFLNGLGFPRYADFDGTGHSELFFAAWRTDKRQIHWLTLRARPYNEPSSDPLDFRDTDSGLSGGSYGDVQPNVLGDVDGDGKVDAVSILRWIPLFLQGAYNRVVIAFGDGAGRFSRTSQIAGTDGAQAASLADVNADGKLDLVVSRSDMTPLTLYGDGTGQFSTTPP